MTSISGNLFGRFGRLVIYFCSLFFGVGNLPALEFASRTWQTDEGLPHNTVHAIAQTQDGYLWVGTRNGIARFDGNRFVVFNSSNTPEIKGRVMYALCAASDGSLWIGSDDGGGITRLKNGKFSHYGTADGLINESIKTIFESSDGTLWVGTRAGISVFQNGKFSPLPQRDAFAKNVISQFYEDSRGRFWVVADAGLFVSTNGVLNFFPLQNEKLHTLMRGICEDHDGNLWLGTMVGMARLNEQGLSYFIEADGLAEKVVTWACQDKKRNLWVGTTGGLHRFNGGRFETILNNEGEAFDQVNAMFEDVEGNLWIGGKEGLSRIRPKQFLAYTRKAGLSANNVMSVFEDNAGSVWVPTWGGGLNEIKHGKVIVHHLGEGFMTSEMFLSVTRTRDGTLWVGCDFNAGLIRFRNGEVQRFDRGTGTLSDDSLRVLCEDHEGNLWIGTRSALLKYRDESTMRFTTADGLSGNLIQAILEDHGNNLWIATDNGVTRYAEGKFTVFRDGLSDVNVTAIYEDREQTMWFGTRHGGINRWKDGRFVPCSQAHGLFDDTVFEIVEDDFGFFWMSSLRGIARVKKDDLNEFLDGKTQWVACVAFGKADGLSSTQCNGVSKPAGWKGKDGRIWFPTTKGVVVVDPGVSHNSKPPKAVIEEVLVNRQNLISPLANPTEITVLPGRKDLEIRYTALSFAAAEKNLFRYKLEGVDADWVEAGSRRSAYYNNIAPGEYRFLVKACNNDGLWAPLPASIQLTFQPYIWQTKWFVAVAGAFAVALVAAAARYLARKRVQQQLLRLEQQNAVEKERARIARDMHDDLGARLTQILMLNEFALKAKSGEDEIKSHVSKAAYVAQDLVRNLDAIVWAVDPQNDSLDRLASYLYEYFEMFFAPSSIRYRLDVPATLPPWPVSSEVRHNIFLVLKEALNNVVKHSSANEVWLRLRLEGSQLKISVEDNGLGLPTAAESGFSSGLLNMRKRIEKIGGHFELGGETGKGTRIQLIIPVNNF